MMPKRMKPYKHLNKQCMCYNQKIKELSPFYFFILCIRDSAYADPDYQKLCARYTHVRSIRKGQPRRGAMARPRPGGTAFMITVSSAPSKL